MSTAGDATAARKRPRTQEDGGGEGEGGTPGKLTRQNSSEDETALQRPACRVYIVEKKLSSGRLSHLRAIAKRKGIPLADSISDTVSHVVSALPSYERVQAAVSSPLPDATEVVSLEWLTTSFIEGKPVQVTDHYRLKKTPALERPLELAEAKHSRLYKPTDYECQRPTLLEHHNHTLTDALELLERYYQFLDYKQGDTRALAFRQASCALKAFPKKVTHFDEISSLPRIGRHSGQVVQEILRHGFSTEVEQCKSSEWFQCMEVFTSVYGCGPATADRWYQKGLRGIEDVCHCRELELTELQQLGLKYHDHLSLPVPRAEAEHIAAYVQTQAKLCFPETSVEAVGGYRRGKPFGHDVDLLLTHPDSKVTDILLETLLDHLHKQGVIIHADVTTGHNTASHVQHDHVNTSRHNYTPDGRQRRVKFDHLDKAFLIMRLESPRPLPPAPAGSVKCEAAEESDGQPVKTGAEADTPQPTTPQPTTITRRVDLIVSPPEQYPFALVSWTGSKQFNRSLRRYSVKECNMTVTAHGVYDITQGKFIPAETEQDVFSILNLKYLEPWERNC